VLLLGKRAGYLSYRRRERMAASRGGACVIAYIVRRILYVVPILIW